jgi:hydroxymethylbilane synthase
VGVLDDPDSRAAVTAERAFLKRLQGGCQVPIGAYAEVLEDKKLRLTGIVSDLDGSRFIRRSETADSAGVEAARSLGLRLAEALLDAGCGEILDQVRTALAFPAEESG